MVRDLRESLRLQGTHEGDIGDDAGEYSLFNTRSTLVKHLPFISCLHSNFDAMRKKILEVPEDEEEDKEGGQTLRIPLQRPRRDPLDHSRVLSKQRFETDMSYSIAGLDPKQP